MSDDSSPMSEPPKVRVRRGADRGHFDHGWLNTRHTFSFAAYRDPAHMGFRSLRVINEDRVASGSGFGTHGHDNMEIISYVLEGELEHKDSMGHGETLTPGEFQCISAGSGITHSEFNPSSTSPTHFYQIWITPDRRDVTPSYQQKRFDPSEIAEGLRLVASPDGDKGSLRIHQNAGVYLGQLASGQSRDMNIDPGRGVWLQLLRGELDVVGNNLSAGDGISLENAERLSMTARQDAEVMVFDLA